MKTPHKHADLIKAWADGAEIEVYNAHGEWVGYYEGESPSWSEDFKYRIKHQPKPDKKYDLRVYEHSCSNAIDGWIVPHLCWPSDVAPATLRLTFDGETGKLKSAEVL